MADINHRGPKVDIDIPIPDVPIDRYMTEPETDVRPSIQSIVQMVSSTLGCQDVKIEVDRDERLVRFIYIWDDNHKYIKDCDFDAMIRFEIDKEEMALFMLATGREAANYAVKEGFIPDFVAEEFFPENGMADLVKENKKPNVYKFMTGEFADPGVLEPPIIDPPGGDIDIPVPDIDLA